MPGMTYSTYSGVHNQTWAGDHINAENVLPGGVLIDPAQFLATDAVVVTATANAIVGATAITVTALSGAIPANTALVFTGNKVAVVSSAGALAGATSVPVLALAAQVNNTDTATYAGTGRKNVASGTPIGATQAEVTAGTPWGPAVSTDDYVRLTSHDVLDLTAENNYVALYRPGRVVYEKNLPNYAQMAAALLTKLRTIYECSSRGAD